MNLHNAHSLQMYLDLSRVFPAVQHLAFPLKRHDVFDILQLPGLSEGLRKLPALETLVLLIAPEDEWTGFRGYTVALFEPLDVPVERLDGLTPSAILKQVESNLKASEPGNIQKWQSPSVEFYVMGRRKFKRSGFCIKSEYWEPPLAEIGRFG
jgi:hypothetical protein